MAETPTLSLCMIVKNEEDFIGQAIKSVLPIVSEVIVVDTGSTDKTIEIAKSLGARIYSKEWNNDFSAARNFSISKAKGDWILVLDADEIIAAKDLETLRQNLSDPTICWEMTQRHYSNDHRLSDYSPKRGEYPEEEKNYEGYFSSSLVRLFPNKAGVHYKGRVHELAEHSIYCIKKLQIKRSQIPIHHYGHIPEVLEKKNKHKLYGDLGQNKISDNPTDWKGFYELGVEYNKPQSLNESVLAFKRSLQLNPHYVATWINLGYVLCELGRYEESAGALFSALKLEPKNHEAHCNLGVVFLRTSAFDKAELHFKEAIKISPNYLNAYFNLSSVYAAVSRLSEAAHVLKKILELSPNNQRATSDLSTLYQAAGRI